MAATRIFFRNEKILFLAKVIEFSNRENTFNSENVHFRENAFKVHFPGIVIKLRVHNVIVCIFAI